MFAVINTFNNNAFIFGRVVSRHHTVKAAVKAAADKQRACKRINGTDTYLPLEIRRISSAVKTGDKVTPQYVAALTDGEQDEADSASFNLVAY